MNKIWERVLANSFSGIHKSKIICSVGRGMVYSYLQECRQMDDVAPEGTYYAETGESSGRSVYHEKINRLN